MQYYNPKSTFYHQESYQFFGHGNYMTGLVEDSIDVLRYENETIAVLTIREGVNPITVVDDLAHFVKSNNLSWVPMFFGTKVIICMNTIKPPDFKCNVGFVFRYGTLQCQRPDLHVQDHWAEWKLPLFVDIPANSTLEGDRLHWYSTR